MNTVHFHYVRKWNNKLYISINHKAWGIRLETASQTIRENGIIPIYDIKSIKVSCQLEYFRPLLFMDIKLIFQQPICLNRKAVHYLIANFWKLILPNLRK